jgi:uncharacterized membrane protein YgcG
MRAHEIINEVFVGSIFLPDVELSVNDHAYDQADKRRINYELIDQVVKKVNSVAPELGKLSPMEQVYIHDPQANISLGMSRLRTKYLVVGLITVINGRPHPDGRTKIIDIPSTASAGNPSNSFAKIAQNAVRKIAPEPREPTAKKTGGGSGGGMSGGMSGGGGLGSGGRSMSGGAGMLNPDPLAQLLR